MHLATTMSARTAFKTILVPFDFSPASEHALRVAASFAALGESVVVLVSVVERPLYPNVAYANIPAAMAEERRDRHRQLARLVDGQPRLRGVVREGSAKEEIVRCARAEAADLIVIGVHAEHGLAHWLRGSVVEHVVANAPCHVLVVKPDAISAERAA
jgi:nucleotide-binding universal stress UspA family protein